MRGAGEQHEQGKDHDRILVRRAVKQIGRGRRG
jgi:hypothetical protein